MEISSVQFYKPCSTRRWPILMMKDKLKYMTDDTEDHLACRASVKGLICSLVWAKHQTRSTHFSHRRGVAKLHNEYPCARNWCPVLCIATKLNATVSNRVLRNVLVGVISSGMARGSQYAPSVTARSVWSLIGWAASRRSDSIGLARRTVAAASAC